MAFIRVDGLGTVDYGFFEDVVKPCWKGVMKKEIVKEKR